MSVHIARRGFGILAITLAIVTVFAAVSAGGRAHAQQAGQPVEDGGVIRFDGCQLVTIEVVESDAFYESVFYSYGNDPDSGGVTLGVTNLDEGAKETIGEVPAGEELVLGIVVETGFTFKTGPADRNPDTEVHAIVSGNTVGFEDLHANAADWDYDDAVLTISTEPCEVAQTVTLNLEIDPASTGAGGVGGGGSFALGATANPSASPAAGSTFGGWSGDCGGFAVNIAVLMDKDRTCFALFLAPPVEPTPEPTVEPTATPEPLGSTIDIANTRTSASPANVGDTVVFRIDVGLTDVPVTNEADVFITFDDAHLAYVGALASECSTIASGIVCDFGAASVDFSFDLDFTALAVTDSTATNATLGADFDGAGPGAAAVAGPASADVAIVDVEGIQLPPLGDGSFTAGSSTAGPLTIVLWVIALGSVGGAALGGVSRRRSSEQ